ncbi:MAG: polymerase epsilon subunit [Gammaproteobacteria bacterium]|jgi:DNA polymerase-3 subunit epsilon|nr:polymerase epsilon subunit [Gammaproteobacteria bacterium]
MRKTTDLNAVKIMPLTPGVYFFYSHAGHLLYIGKSISLRNRVYAHILAAKYSSKEERLIRQTSRIEWEETAGELGALLREATLIKQYQPIYNQRLRKNRVLYGLKLRETENQYSRIELVRLNAILQHEIPLLYGLSRSKRELMQKIVDYTKQWNLCAKLTLLEKGPGPCFYFQIKRCKGACLNLENPTAYNARVTQAFRKLRVESWPYSSSIIIKEKSLTTLRVDYHKIDRWCHLLSGKNKKVLSHIETSFPHCFDFDIYKILVKYLLAPSSTIKIIPDFLGSIDNSTMPAVTL